jgi:hypothetical protein
MKSLRYLSILGMNLAIISLIYILARRDSDPSEAIGFGIFACICLLALSSVVLAKITGGKNKTAKN